MMDHQTKTVETKIQNELKKITAHLKGSNMEEEAVGEHGISMKTKLGNPEKMIKLLESKVNFSDLEERLKIKTN